MAVEVYFISGQQNGAPEKVFFKSPFEWKGAPPSINEELYGKGGLKGVVVDVKDIGDSTRTLLWTEMSTEDLEHLLIPDGWKKLSHWLE